MISYVAIYPISPSTIKPLAITSIAGTSITSMTNISR